MAKPHSGEGPASSPTPKAASYVPPPLYFHLRSYVQHWLTHRFPYIRMSEVKSMAWSPDGRQLAVSYNDGVLDILSYNGKSYVANHRIMPVIAKPSLHWHREEYVRQVKWSPDGTMIAAWVHMGFIVWDVKTGRQLVDAQHIEEWSDFPDEYSWSPDSKMLMTTVNKRDLMLWKARSDKGLQHIWKMKPDAVTGDTADMISEIAWRPDSKTIAIVYSRDGEYGPSRRCICLFDTEQKRNIEKISQVQQCLSIDWSPDGQTYVNTEKSSRMMTLWAYPNRLICKLAEPGDVNTWSPDSKRLVTTLYQWPVEGSKTVQIWWDAETGYEITRIVEDTHIADFELPLKRLFEWGFIPLSIIRGYNALSPSLDKTAKDTEWKFEASIFNHGLYFTISMVHVALTPGFHTWRSDGPVTIEEVLRAIRNNMK